MAPTPKPRGQRVRRNIDQGRWKTLPAAKPFERPPPLPPRRREGGDASAGDELAKANRAELNELAEEAGVRGATSLPNKAAVVDAIRQARTGWLPTTVEWWELLWASPMAAMWIEADVPMLVELAVFEDERSRGRSLSGPAYTRKTHIEDRYGLSPKSRRQLQWEIAKADEEATKQHQARSRARVKPVDAREARALARR